MIRERGRRGKEEGGMWTLRKGGRGHVDGEEGRMGGHEAQKNGVSGYGDSLEGMKRTWIRRGRVKEGMKPRGEEEEGAESKKEEGLAGS